jgi:hypothetical protein
MAITYEPIATTTLGSNQSTVTFSTISGSYTDLIVVANATLSAGVGFGMQFNSDTGSNYSFIYFYGDGSSAAAGQNTSQTRINIGNGNTTYSTYRAHIQNYSNTTTYKSVISNGGIGNEIAMIFAGSWRSNSAITSITFVPASGTINTGTTFTLYGIKAA